MRNILLTVLMVSVVLVSPATAATVLEFHPTGAPPGERITGKTVGGGMEGITSGRVTVFLARSNRAADLATGPGDSKLTKFGVMTADEKDVGHFEGTVPALDPGSYIAVAYCRECVQGGSVFTVGEFEVTGAILPRTGIPLVWWVAIAGTLIASGSAFRNLT
jgi:hypothetical protein